jgi:DNA-binding CsgD family transcriptional regulator
MFLWLMVGWVLFNFGLFFGLFIYALRLRRHSGSSSIEFVATALVLVAGAFLLGSVQRVGIHAARVELIPLAAEAFFLSTYQVVLSLAGSVAGYYAFTKLRTAIRRIEEGERMVSVLTESVPLSARVSDWGLTARELQVLETIVSGQTSDEQIAETLFISKATAATHVRNILRKAGMSKRLDLMLVGSRRDEST